MFVFEFEFEEERGGRKVEVLLLANGKVECCTRVNLLLSWSADSKPTWKYNLLIIVMDCHVGYSKTEYKR